MTKIEYAVIGTIVLILAVLIGSAVYQATYKPAITVGTVVATDFEAGHTETTFVGTWSGDQMILVPHNVYHPPRWTVTIEGDDPKHPGQTVRETFDVPRALYDRVQVGEMFNAEGL